VLARRLSIASRRPPAARRPLKRPHSRPVALQKYRGRDSNPHGRGPRRSRRRASTVPPPRCEAPGQGIEPRSPRSERGVLPVRRSRTVPLRSAPARGELDAKAFGQTVLGMHVEPPMSMPLAYPSTLDRRPRACTSAGRRRRGGALEPESRALLRNVQAKAQANAKAQFQHRAQEQSFSLRRGLDSF
jgi:hypothetical protein